MPKQQRLSQPLIQAVQDLPALPIDSFKLDNDLPVYALTGGTQPITKVEIVFMAGRPYEQQKLVSTTCAALIREGTHLHSSTELAQKVDFYGATLISTATFDTIRIQLYTLSKHLEHLLPHLAEVIRYANFPETELHIFKERAKQRLSIDLAQNEVLAYRAATEGYFGAHHPYGYNSTGDLYDSVERTALLEHYEQLITPGQALCFVAGSPPTNYVTLLQDSIGHWFGAQTSSPNRIPVVPNRSGRSVELQGTGLQSAIRIGRRLFGRSDPDFPGMFVLNTALGGYFGSRLMRNLREEKGLTYGVESSLETMRFDGYFTVCLETEKSLAQKAIDEIHREIEILQRRYIERDELQMIKNYLGGYLLSLMDGPLQIVEILRGNLVRKNPVDFTKELLYGIQNIEPDELRFLAQKHLSIEGLDHVVVH